MCSKPGLSLASQPTSKKEGGREGGEENRYLEIADFFFKILKYVVSKIRVFSGF